MTIEELEQTALTERELRELYEKYDNLYQEETDSEKRTELYDLCLYLSSRLENVTGMREDMEEQYVSREAYEELQRQLKNLQIANDVILEKVELSQVKQLAKKDLMQIFDKEEDWVLNLLRYMCQQKYAVKINREYYTSKEQLEVFLDTYRGTELKINTR